MVKLATPISSLFKDEFSRRQIIVKSCCLECREEVIENREKKQYLFHFDKNIVHLWGEKEKNFLSLAVSAKKELRLITFHIAAACSRPVFKKGVFYCGGREFSREDMLNNASVNLSWLRALIGNRNIKVGVENNNYYPTSAYRYITDVDFINQLVTENQVLFLFDIAHAKITAHNKKEPYAGYIADLPWDHLIQIHVSKHGFNGQGLAYDAHELPDELIFQEVKKIVDKFSPEYITIEYYRDKDNLVKVLDHFKELCDEPINIKI